MQAVIQEEETGCGIAAVATILAKTYPEMKAIANAQGIFATDRSLWSDTAYVRTLLADAGVTTSAEELPFRSWHDLPDLALLAIKFHQQDGRDYWHWVVFYRADGHEYVLDSASYLAQNRRTDFSAMQPKWFIRVEKPACSAVFYCPRKRKITA